MATIVSTLFMSLDGVVDIDPAWHFPYFDEQVTALAAEPGIDKVLVPGSTSVGPCAARGAPA